MSFLLSGRNVAVSFADPQSVTISGTAVSLPRTSSGQNSGVFTSSDGLTQLSVASTLGKRTNRVAKLSLTKISADPLMPSTNVRSTHSCWIAYNGPSNGAFTVAEAKALVDALTAYMSASTGARVTQLLGGEN